MEDLTTSGQEKRCLQEADPDYGRPAELGEGGLFEMEGRQMSQIGDGQREASELEGGGRRSNART